MMPFGHKDSVGTFPNHLAFPYDIVDKRSEYVITADIPGASKDMVEVSVDDDRVLHIVDERADRHEERGGSEADGACIFIYVWEISLTSCFCSQGPSTWFTTDRSVGSSGTFSCRTTLRTARSSRR